MRDMVGCQIEAVLSIREVEESQSPHDVKSGRERIVSVKRTYDSDGSLMMANLFTRVRALVGGLWGND